MNSQSWRFVALLGLMAVGLPGVAIAQTSQKSDEAAGVIFEDSFEKGRKAPDGWKTGVWPAGRGSAVPGVEYVYDKKIGSTGKRSLGLKKSGRGYFPVAEWYRIIPAPDAAAVDIKAMVKARGASKATFEVRFLNKANRMISKKWVGYIGQKKQGDAPATHDWKSYGETAELPPGTSKLLIAFQIYGPGTVWFDDLKVTKADKPAAAANADPNARASVETTKIKINGVDAEYIFKAARKPSSKPQGVLVVLPGGDGSAEFHPFVSWIHSTAAGADFVLAQPIAKKWTANQKIVWPILNNKVTGMKFSTEEFVDAVVKDIEKTQSVDRKRIFVVAWSSGGLAAYSLMLQDKPIVTGGLIAMSVFKPDYLPKLAAAAKRNFYVLHSPDDKTCPHWMAKAAKQKLTANGANIVLKEYQGGHGWRGDATSHLAKGLRWLEAAAN